MTENDNPPVSEIIIYEIEHLMPINVSCSLDGKDVVVTAYFDHSTNRIHIPKETSWSLGGSEDLFRDAILSFYTAKTEEVVARHAMEYPPQVIEEEYGIPEMPEADEEESCPTE